MALLAGGAAYADQIPGEHWNAGDTTQAPANPPVFSFGTSTTNGTLSVSNPVRVEVDLIGPLLNDGATLFAIATLDKDVVTDELINFNNYVNLAQTVDDTLADDFAESSAMGIQVNSDNRDCSNCAEKTDTIGGATAGAGAGNNDVGLVSINQAGGNMNNQGTLVSVAVDSATPNQPPNPPPPHTPPPPTPTPPTGTPGDPNGAFAHAQAEATQVNGNFGGGESDGNTVEAVDLIQRTSLIDNSFNGDRGLVYGNQATGNNNNQLNELSLAFAERARGVAIAESDLGQFNTGNLVGESASIEDTSSPGINKTATIDTSLNGDRGVIGVNQAVGNNGNQANIVSIAAVGTNLPGF
jgi:hypothetical protein